jgi:pSer/pThr/pTyr-binding forkhead associated (FHA) protein
MFKLLIADDEGKTTVVPLVRDEVTIGRKEGNTIRLTERNVSRKHAKLRRANGVFFVSDLKSFNGVRVNGRRIEGEIELKSGDQIVIGDYQLALQFEGTEQIDTGPTTTAPMMSPSENEGPTALVPSPPVVDHGPPARLVMVSPPTPGAEFALSRPRLRIGRAEDLEIWVNHRSISREHAEVAVENGAVYIRDLASANGVRVNGVDTKQGPVRSGDVIELGQVRFRMVGAGEHFHFDAERTIQMDALAPPPPTNRAPIFIAVGIVGLALVVGVGVALSGGGTTEPRVTQIESGLPAVPGVAPVPGAPVTTAAAAPPGPALDAQVNAAVSACQISLSSGNFAAAITRANEALTLRPGDPHATECLTSATRVEAEDRTFSAGANALRANDLAGAVDAFDQLPDGSSFLNRPEVAQAYDAYSRELLAQARDASDPSVAAGLADHILQLPNVDPAVAQQAQAISRRGGATVVAVRAPRGGGGGGGGQRPDRTARPPERGTTVATSQGGGGGGGGGTQGGGGGGTTQSGGATGGGGGVDATAEARVCIGNGDYSCVIRVLGGRARTYAELNMLANAYRQTRDMAAACRTYSQIIDRYPSQAQAARQFHASQCQGH